jgi:hypothetical protein
LKTKIRFDQIAAANGRYATTHSGEPDAGIWIKLLRDSGLEVETLHDWRDVTFRREIARTERKADW